jgi:hypothetical protein
MTESPKHPDASLINDDIRPVRSAERHWSVMSMAEPVGRHGRLCADLHAGRRASSTRA